MQFLVARGVQPTGRILQSLVEAKAREAGVRLPNEALVCYGQGAPGRNPSLNSQCSALSKMAQGQRLFERLGVGGAIRILSPEAAIRYLGSGDGLPLLGRTTSHTQGRDITVCLEPWQAQARVTAGLANFFTPYYPSDTEYRVWVYRRRHLGTYEKVLRRPEAFKKIGRNYHNGFNFSFRDSENIPEVLKERAREAIAALNLDFGAVDILKQGNGYIVLEVNSAPGVSDERRNVINRLAHRIVRWAANGCPRRENGIE